MKTPLTLTIDNIFDYFWLCLSVSMTLKKQRKYYLLKLNLSKNHRTERSCCNVFLQLILSTITTFISAPNHIDSTFRVIKSPVSCELENMMIKCCHSHQSKITPVLFISSHKVNNIHLPKIDITKTVCEISWLL